jgi:hypothetical protein
MNKSRVASSCSTVRWTDVVVAPEEDAAVAVASHTSSKATKGDMFDLISSAEENEVMSRS